jgi:hypothetical protein
MFEDERFECITIREVYEELTQTTKFKTKYPWAGLMRNRLKSLPAGKTGSDDVNLYHEAIKNLVEIGTTDQKTERLFDLSNVDMRVVACALAFGYRVSSGDGGMIRFLEQEFSGEFKGNISPLGLLNMWIEKKLIVWDDEKQEHMAEWNENEEHAQPKTEIRRFTKLTGRRYPGS